MFRFFRSLLGERLTRRMAIPSGYLLLRRILVGDNYQRNALFILFMTYICYILYHASRKPISVVKGVLHASRASTTDHSSSGLGWAPFDQDNWSQLIGGLEYGYLLIYAFSMVVSGYIAERTNLRHFLTVGLVLSGLANIAFGAAWYLNIHSYAYFMAVQLFSGIFQATGWPVVVTLVANWWGKSKRGLIMGVWTSHTSIGNMLGSLVAGYYVDRAWGASFVVPGLMMIVFAVFIFCTLIDHPKMLGLTLKEAAPISPLVVKDHRRNNSESKSEFETFILPDHDEVTKETFLETSQPNSVQAISLWKAVMLPNVLAYSIILFFNKLVGYTFLYWLPNYLSMVSDEHVTAETAAQLSVLFDLGGLVGGVLSGIASDAHDGAPESTMILRRAVTCAIMFGAAAPLLMLYQQLGSSTSALSLVVLFCCGAAVNGPFALITSAVSADLGTQQAVRGHARALATITSIIDGTGSLGAALGPFLTGLLVPFGWYTVFVMLILSDILALITTCWVISELPKKSSKVFDGRKAGIDI